MALDKMAPVGEELTTSTNKQMIEFDEALVEHVGEFGCFQIKIYLLLAYLWVAVAFAMLNIVFIAGVPDHHCAVPPPVQKLLLANYTTVLTDLFIPKDEDGQYLKCVMYDYGNISFTLTNLNELLTSNLSSSNRTKADCRYGWSYDTSIYTSTIVSQWNLVCQDRSWTTVLKSVYMTGLVAGCLIFGNVADRVGRKPTTLFLVTLFFGLNIGVGFVNDVVLFATIRFFIAMSVIGLINCCYVEIIEIIGPNWRVFGGVSVTYFWIFGTLVLTACAYFIRDYFTLHWVLLGASSPLLLFFCFMPESPRWLFTTSRTDRGMKLLKKVALGNGKKLPEDIDIVVKQQTRANVLDLFRTPNIRKKTLILCYCWMINSMVYYAISLNTSSLAGSPYVNFFISSLVDIPGVIMSFFIFKYIGRRFAIVFALTVGGAALLSVASLPEDIPNAVIIALTMFGKFCMSTGFGVLYQFSGELMPTCVRTVGLSTGSMCARIGAALAPIIYDLGKAVNFKPLGMIIFGCCCIVGGLLGSLLPETRGKNLPECLDDGEQFGKKQSKKQKYEVNDTDNKEMDSGLTNL